MYRMCLRYAKSEDEAMEIVNAGFLRVFTKLDTFAFKGSLEGWIRRLCFHCLADHYRKQDRQVHFLALEDRDAPTEASPLQRLYFEDIIQLVDKLPQATREVFWLYAVEGYTHVEIAEKVGISSGTSKWHLSNARKKLKALLEQQYYNGNQYAG
ncbi:MAG: RNA polymerase sigma factor [Lewinella sp.]|nr:RNA polymerase sigma factor [Lewinella sp.]